MFNLKRLPFKFEKWWAVLESMLQITLISKGNLNKTLYLKYGRQGVLANINLIDYPNFWETETAITRLKFKFTFPRKPRVNQTSR